MIKFFQNFFVSLLTKPKTITIDTVTTDKQSEQNDHTSRPEWHRESAIFVMARELEIKFYLNHWIWNWAKRYASHVS